MNEKSAKFTTNSSRETIELGKLIGFCLQEEDVIGLIGELGTGKTWITKGVGLGLGIQSENMVTSPSFTLVNIYEGRLTIYHMDAYRLKEATEFLESGLEEYFFMGGVAVLEWADRWPAILPPHSLKIRIEFSGENSRNILLTGSHPRAIEIIECVVKGAKEKGGRASKKQLGP